MVARAQLKRESKPQPVKAVEGMSFAPTISRPGQSLAHGVALLVAVSRQSTLSPHTKERARGSNGYNVALSK